MSLRTETASPSLATGTRVQNTVASRSVAALSTPPTPSMASLTSRAVGYRSPPLNTMCSTKWLRPLSDSLSWREPTATMKAIATEARPGSGTAVSLVPPDRDSTPNSVSTTARLPAAALGGDVRILGQGHVDDPTLVGVHGVERVGLAGALDTQRKALRQLANLVFATGAVALDIEDDPARLHPFLAEHEVDRG